MPVFAKPDFPFVFDVAKEKTLLRRHKRTRGIPRRKKDHLLVCSWNVANFGAQDREDRHLELIAEIVSWFDVLVLQELRDDYADLERLLQLLPKSFRYIMSDVAGNTERMAYLYRSRKVDLLELIGEVAVPPADHRHIKLPGITRKFVGFDRNPYVAAFGSGRSSFMFANAHLYFGNTSTKAKEKASLERRALEAYALARWADLRRESDSVFTREIIALGDMNIPKRDKSDPIMKALTARGLRVPDHSTKVSASIASDFEYDQVAVFPGATSDRITAGLGVFDFDKVIYPALYQTRKRSFKGYLKYYISDHRPLWFEMKLD